MNRSLLGLLSVTLLTGLISCVTPPIQNFSKVQVGMDKTDVLDKVGSPIETESREGRLVFTYRFFENDKIIYKEVRFNKDEYVESIGDPSPAKAAARDHTSRSSVSKSKAWPVMPTPAPKPVFREVDPAIDASGETTTPH